MKKFIYTRLGTVNFDETQIPPKSLEGYSDTPEEAECAYYISQLEKYSGDIKRLNEKIDDMNTKIKTLNTKHSHLKHLFPEKFI